MTGSHTYLSFYSPDRSDQNGRLPFVFIRSVLPSEGNSVSQLPKKELKTKRTSV